MISTKYASQNPASDYPIALADQSGNSEMLRLLLNNVSTTEDCAAVYDLNWAVRGQRIVAIVALLDLGRRPDELQHGTTLLHLAAEKNWLSTLHALLGAKPDLEVTDSAGATPLHIILLIGHEQIVQALLDAGADKESRKESFTPLHSAISEQKINFTKILLNKGASPMAEADNGISDLHLAVMANDLSTVVVLLTRYPALPNTKTR